MRTINTTVATISSIITSTKGTTMAQLVKGYNKFHGIDSFVWENNEVTVDKVSTTAKPVDVDNIVIPEPKKESPASKRAKRKARLEMVFADCTNGKEFHKAHLEMKAKIKSLRKQEEANQEFLNNTDMRKSIDTEIILTQKEFHQEWFGEKCEVISADDFMSAFITEGGSVLAPRSTKSNYIRMITEKGYYACKIKNLKQYAELRKDSKDLNRVAKEFSMHDADMLSITEPVLRTEKNILKGVPMKRNTNMATDIYGNSGCCPKCLDKTGYYITLKEYSTEGDSGVFCETEGCTYRHSTDKTESVIDASTISIGADGVWTEKQAFFQFENLEGSPVYDSADLAYPINFADVVTKSKKGNDYFGLFMDSETGKAAQTEQYKEIARAIYMQSVSAGMDDKAARKVTSKHLREVLSWITEGGKKLSSKVVDIFLESIQNDKDHTEEYCSKSGEILSYKEDCNGEDDMGESYEGMSAEDELTESIDFDYTRSSTDFRGEDTSPEAKADSRLFYSMIKTIDWNISKNYTMAQRKAAEFLNSGLIDTVFGRMGKDYEFVAEFKDYYTSIADGEWTDELTSKYRSYFAARANFNSFCINNSSVIGYVVTKATGWSNRYGVTICANTGHEIKTVTRTKSTITGVRNFVYYNNAWMDVTLDRAINAKSKGLEVASTNGICINGTWYPVTSNDVTRKALAKSAHRVVEKDLVVDSYNYIDGGYTVKSPKAKATVTYATSGDSWFCIKRLVGSTCESKVFNNKADFTKYCSSASAVTKFNGDVFTLVDTFNAAVASGKVLVK